ncbi:MAG: 50S ribosomal protein L10 [Holosporales bacterium]|jgi:large subunit ribosomal protein L10|nr:50S ribosomal protein L10 [Holosporales bacterium]
MLRRRRMKRQEKESFVSSIRNELLGASIVIAVSRSAGITVGEITKFRKDMRAANANFKVLKNTLARMAISNSPLDSISEYLDGPTALAYSDNPVGMAKAISEFAKESEKMSVLCGVMDGNAISVDAVKSLASLPSMDELRAQLIGLLTAAATKIVRTVREPSARVARVIALRN